MTNWTVRRLSRFGVTASLFAFSGFSAAAQLAGQTPLPGTARELQLPTFTIAPPSEPSVPETAAFGLSGEVRIVLATTGGGLDPLLLNQAGDGWELGYRWVRLDREQGPRVLGAPTQPPSAAVPLSAFMDTIAAPTEPGIYRLESGSGTALTVIAQVPASLTRGGRLNGYYIGVYPTEGSDRSDIYAPPTGFIEVHPTMTDLPVSKHLRVGQFLTKDQFDIWPKYVALDLRLIDKLELVMQELKAMGVRANRIHVMSGFRTPQYNGPGGGGRAALSRHMWGDAADMWIDDDGNGWMDDLNGDGVVDLNDAMVLMRAVDRVERRHPELVGGAGLYPESDIRGPYIHIDARGYHSRW